MTCTAAAAEKYPWGKSPAYPSNTVRAKLLLVNVSKPTSAYIIRGRPQVASSQENLNHVIYAFGPSRINQAHLGTHKTQRRTTT